MIIKESKLWVENIPQEFDQKKNGVGDKIEEKNINGEKDEIKRRVT